MRTIRGLVAALIVLVSAAGSAGSLSGCSSGSDSRTIDVDANKAEQQLLQEKMQKGFTQKPAARRK